VSQGWPENKQLAPWVNKQRTEKTKFDNGDRKTTITPERISRLNAIGFAWDPKEQAWDKWYGQLQTYKGEHGDCRVPVDWCENKPLASWVVTQRQQKTKFDKGDRKANITPERISRLNAIGFVWDAHEHAWDKRYDELQQKYKNTHGDCRVPVDWCENKQLSTWVVTQRQQKTKFDKGDRKANITPERISRLNDIGFD
jgi:hypothetical protein